MQRFLSVMVIVGIAMAQNHPTTLVIHNIASRWDGEYPIRFAIVGDSYNINFVSLAIFKQVEFIASTLDFVVLVGDFAETGSFVGYQQYLNIIDSIDVPWISVMGNHEINDSLGWDNYIDIFGEPNFHWDVGNARFIALTDCYPAPMPVSLGENVYYKLLPEQLDYIDTLLASWDGYKFVFMHAPPYLYPRITLACLGGFGYSPDYDASLTELFTDILRDRNVYACIYGHIHAFDRWVANNDRYGSVNYILSGGAGGRLGPWPYPPPEGGSFYHFIVAELFENGVMNFFVIRPDTIDDGIVDVNPDSIYSFSLIPPTKVMDTNLPVKQSKIYAYPNPFNSVLNIKLPYNSSTVKVFDCAGNLVCSLEGNMNSWVCWTPEENIKSGLYWLVSGQEKSRVVYLR